MLIVRFSRDWCFLIIVCEASKERCIKFEGVFAPAVLITTDKASDPCGMIQIRPLHKLLIWTRRINGSYRWGCVADCWGAVTNSKASGGVDLLLIFSFPSVVILMKLLLKNKLIYRFPPGASTLRYAQKVSLHILMTSPLTYDPRD